GDVAVQAAVRDSGRLAVEAGGQGSAELRASHMAIVLHSFDDRRGRARVGGVRLDGRDGGRRG
ncbi:hypothetical protein, partial [Kitasatospora sp. NPDC093558]|uniref:hypothetical protein n=1 Tax=Kitasatospora sp. NPDC093558 TaxID=3155201 RepID=UPI00342AB053